jgi:predicted amidohydrolase YtcJ
LTNGKVVTVDDSFSIAQAVAIKGGRIVAVGRTADIAKLADAGTKTIDLKGRTVIPGLIDNHAHFVRVAEKWHSEMRLDGITSRQQVVKMLQERVRAARSSSPTIRAGSRWRSSTGSRRTIRWRCRQSTARPGSIPLR